MSYPYMLLKDRFYEHLKQLTRDKQSGEEHVILGHFNARVGARQRSNTTVGSVVA